MSLKQPLPLGARVPRKKIPHGARLAPVSAGTLGGLSQIAAKSFGPQSDHNRTESDRIGPQSDHNRTTIGGCFIASDTGDFLVAFQFAAEVARA